MKLVSDFLLVQLNSQSGQLFALRCVYFVKGIEWSVVTAAVSEGDILITWEMLCYYSYLSSEMTGFIENTHITFK